jgi:hypothetical protein
MYGPIFHVSNIPLEIMFWLLVAEKLFASVDLEDASLALPLVVSSKLVKAVDAPGMPLVSATTFLLRLFCFW